jgi:hypothetical protein
MKRSFKMKKKTRSLEKKVFLVAAVMAAIFMTTATAFAADGDPLQVVNNLSDLIFGMIPAIGVILQCGAF